jgi:hypothetical protein
MLINPVLLIIGGLAAGISARVVHALHFGRFALRQDSMWHKEHKHGRNRQLSIHIGPHYFFCTGASVAVGS